MSTDVKQTAYIESHTIVDTNQNIESHLKEIQDLDERRRAALAEIDNAKFGWFHIRACIVAGIGFFTDAYDLFAINIVSSMFAWVYYRPAVVKGPPKIDPHVDLLLKASAPMGSMVGQLLFGWLADRFGRKKMYGIELMIIIIATVASAMSGNAFAVSVQGTLIFWRIILGVGIGGDYPLSAIITSEFATTKRRGAMMAAVFAMQGFGILTSAIVASIILVAYKSAIDGNIDNVDYCWRLLIGLGAVPGCIALYFRLTIPETPRYTMDIERNVEQAAMDISNVLRTGKYQERDPDAPVYRVEAPRHSWSDFVAYFGQWKNGKVLLGTALSWFLLDVAYYGASLNNSIILTDIGFAGGTNAYEALQKIAVGNVVINIMGTVPGYWVSVLFIDSWGRKPIQLMGFGVLSVLFFIMGGAYTQITNYSTALFVVLFTFSQFFQNFGPNTTTFVIPGEVFPTRYRSTGHGISAAAGKFGATAVQFLVAYVKYDIRTIILVFACLMTVGFFVTFLVPETKGFTLEELSFEDQKGFVKDHRTQNK